MKVIKIPLNAGAMTKKKGIELAPEKILTLKDDFFMAENNHLPVFDVDEVKIDNSNLEDSHKAIYDKVKGLDSFTVLLGGDHSLTYPAFKAFAETHENAGIIAFDAHPDLENNFEPPTHEDYLRVLIEKGIVKKENVILVGTRNMHANESGFIKKNKLKVFSMKEISFEGVRDVCDAVMSVAKEFGALYLSLDIDSLDPAFAPGIGHTEPGGLTTRELLYFVHRIKKLKNLKMADIVEINPKKDLNDMTSKVAAKLLVELS
ncbi:MAG: arginase family protein [archaeon]